MHKTMKLISKMKKFFLFVLFFCNAFNLFAQVKLKGESVLSNPGVLITIVLILVPLIFVVYLAGVKVNNLAKSIREKRQKENAIAITDSINNLPFDELSDELEKRKDAIEFDLSNTELAG